MATFDPRMLQVPRGFADDGEEEEDEGGTGEDSVDGSSDVQGGGGTGGDEVYTVEKILDYGRFDKFNGLPKPYPEEEERYEMRYHVKWLGYSLAEATWEPRENFDDFDQFLNQVRKVEKKKPKSFSHDAVIEDVRVSNKKWQEDQKRSKKRKSAKKTTAPVKKTKSSSTTSSAVASTSKQVRAGSTSSHRSNSAAVASSSTERRRQRGEQIDQAIFNDFIDSNGIKELRSLRFTPPPQHDEEGNLIVSPESESLGGEDTKNSERERKRRKVKVEPGTQRVEGKGKGKGKEKETIDEIVPNQKGFADDSDEEGDQGGVTQAPPMRGFADDDDEDDDVPMKPPIATRGFADDDDEEEEDVPLQQSQPARGFADSDEDDLKDNGQQGETTAPTGFAVESGDEGDQSSNIASTHAGGFADDSDEEQPAPVSAAQPATQPGFAHDSDEEEIVVASPQARPALGFAASSGDEEQEEQVQVPFTKQGKEREVEVSKSKVKKRKAMDNESSGIRGTRGAAKPVTVASSASNQPKKVPISRDRPPDQQSPPPVKKQKKVIAPSDSEESEDVPLLKRVSSATTAPKPTVKVSKLTTSTSKPSPIPPSVSSRSSQTSSGSYRSPSLPAGSTTTQLGRSVDSKQAKKQEEDIWNHGVSRPISVNGYIPLNRNLLQFKNLAKAICFNHTPQWPLDATDDHERIRFLWKMGGNPLVNFGNFDKVMADREVFITPPPSKNETGRNKVALDQEKEYQALQLVLSSIQGVKQADSPRESVTAAFVHISLLDELGKEGGKLSELDSLRDREEVVVFSYGQQTVKQREMTQIWKPLTAFTFTPSALVEDPHRIAQLVEEAASSRDPVNGGRNQFAFTLPQYVLPGGAFGVKVDEEGTPVSRTVEERAVLYPAIKSLYSLLQAGQLELTRLAPSTTTSFRSETRFPSFFDQTLADPIVWQKLSNCYPSKFCNVGIARLCSLVCRWRSQYSMIRRWIIIATEEEIESLPSVPGLTLATVEEAETLLSRPLHTTIG